RPVATEVEHKFKFACRNKKDLSNVAMVMMKKKQQQGKAGGKKSPNPKAQPFPSPKKAAAPLAAADSDESDSDSDNATVMQPKVVQSPGKPKQSPVAKQPAQQLMDVDDSDSDDSDDAPAPTPKKSPIVAKGQTPAGKKQTPIAKQQTPVAKQQTPAGKKQTPVAKQQTPVAKPQTPVAKQQTPVAKQQALAGKKQTPVAKQQTPVSKKQIIPNEDDDDSDDDEEDDDEDDDSEEEPVAKQQKVIKVPVGKQKDSAESDEDDDESDEEDEEEEDSEEEEQQLPAAKKQKFPANNDEDDSDEDDEEDSEESDEEEAAENYSKPTKAVTNGAEVPVAKATQYLLLGNLEAHTSVSDLKNYLSRRGVPYVSAAVLDSPVAILGLSTAQDAASALAKCQGAAYKSRQLAACQLAGKPDLLLQQTGSSPLPGNTDNAALFVSNLPAEMNDSSLTSLVKSKLGGRADELLSAQLLVKKGSGNAHRGQAIVRLAGTAAAQTLLESLSGHLLAGKPVKASYYVGKAEQAKAAASNKEGKQDTAKTTQKSSSPANKASDQSDLRGQTRTLMLTNLPAEACGRDSDSIRTAFPGGVRYSAKARPGQEFGACFVEFESEQACSDAFDRFGSASKMNGREIGIRFAPQRQLPGNSNKPQTKTIGVFNLPFSATTDSLREHFPEASDMFIPKDQDGRSKGFAIVTFETDEAATKAMSDNASLSLDGRQIRLEYREERPPREGGGRGGGFGGRGGGRGGFGDRGGGRGGRGGFGDRGGGRGGRGGRGGFGGFGDRGGGRGGRGGGFGDRGGRGGFGGGGKRFGGGEDGAPYNKKPRMSTDTGDGNKSKKFDSDSD
ncbi:hypothetical protein BOX15_Mlig020973g1, partial [Macrostomum lignano]